MPTTRAAIRRKAAAKRELNRRFPNTKRYGSQKLKTKASPCERIKFGSKKGAVSALKLAFVARYGRKCRKGFVMSHDCQCTRTVLHCWNSSGICINGDHLHEQKVKGNNKRKQHQNLIRFYLKRTQYKGLKNGPTYVKDVPHEYVVKFWKSKKKAFEHIVCNCEEGEQGACFVNSKSVEDEQ